MDRFVVLETLGEGGSGRVVLAEDRLRPGSRVALKELSGAGDEHAEALRREFATLSTLRHPNLVEVFELDADPATGRPRFTMELVDGDDIVATVRREGLATLPELVAEVLRAITFLHDFGLVHRDLKPQNVLVRRVAKAGHRVVVLDFGLAAARRPDAAAPALALAGTLPYLAPELFDGTAASRRSDLYALGAIVFEAIHGRPPLVPKGGDLTAFVAAVREGRRARPSPPPALPARLGAWVDALLSPDPAQRPSGAQDALAKLNEACGTDFPLETTDDRAARLGSGEPVGRDDELAALRRELEPSASPRVIWLCGDAGSGKTRVARFLASEAIGRGVTVHAPTGGIPGEPDEFLARLRGDAARGPTLLLIDEVERSGNAVASLLDRIAREPREAPIRVLAAVRPGELVNPKLRKLLADTGAVPSLARVELSPLGEAGLKAMIERATAGRSSAQARVKWLGDASEGNAGAAEALLVEGVWERRGKLPVAAALEQSIRRRLERLSPEARAWLEALAVLGEDVPEALAGELAGLEERSAAAGEEVVAAGLARRAGSAASPDSRRVADAVRASASPERLARLHAMAATHYAAHERDAFGATAWRLARLWRGAGETDRAVAAALDASSAAEVAKDWEAAAERVRFALTLLPRHDERRGALWARRAEALRQARFHREAVRAFGWSARYAKEAEPRLEARARRAKALFMAGRLDASEAAANQVLEEAKAAGSEVNQGRAWEVIADVRIQRFALAECLSAATEAVHLLHDENGEDLAAALSVLAGAESRLGRPAWQAHLTQGVEICEARDLPYLRLILLLGQAQAEERAGLFESAARTLERASALSLERRQPQWLRRVQHLNSRVAAIQGRFDVAVESGRASEELAWYTNEPSMWGSAVTLVAEALIDAGRHTAARAYLRERIGGPLRSAPPVWLACHRAIYSQIVETHEDAHLTLDDLELMRSSGPAHRATSLEVELLATVPTPAARSTDIVLAETFALLADTGESVPAYTRIRLRLAAAHSLLSLNKPEPARDLLLSVPTTHADPADPLRLARTRFLLADCLDRSGRKEDAAGARSEGARLIDVAAERIADPDWRRDFLDQPLVRELLATIPKPADSKRVDALYDMIGALNSETDPEALLESILDMAMRTVEAERGMILLSGPSGSDFSVRLARNLEKETQADAEAFSRRIVSQAGSGESVIALDAGQDERFKDFKSVSLFRIRSLMCVPLRSRGRIVGTVYLDSRRQGKLFSQDDLRFVEGFAHHAALALENARRRADLENENRRLKAVVGERSSYASIVGRSPAMQKVFDLLERVAPSDATVLIQGESGTGKELVARALHFNGPRKEKAFVSENCAAMAESLLESELFGHVRGAFTGAERDRAGVFEQAHGGTLFLDEIGDMSPGMQARLLRVLQEGELRRVGGEHPIRVDVRLIAATNKDLLAAVGAGRFREDLYYRLAVVPVQLPPLRERIGDVPLIAGHLLAQIAAARGRVTPHVDSDVLDALERYPWPGNVRQLENLLRRMSLLAGDGSINREVLESDSDLARTLLGKQDAFVPVMSMEKSEQDQIRRALEAAAGNRDRAARLLGISRATIYRKMREYGLR